MPGRKPGSDPDDVQKPVRPERSGISPRGGRLLDGLPEHGKYTGRQPVLTTAWLPALRPAHTPRQQHTLSHRSAQEKGGLPPPSLFLPPSYAILIFSLISSLSFLSRSLPGVLSRRILLFYGSLPPLSLSTVILYLRHRKPFSGIAAVHALPKQCVE